MTSTISFQNANSGMQTGINHGTINAQFNLHADPLDKLPIANGAEFDSYTDQHEDECLPGTRTQLLNEIAEWAVSSHGKCIFWLNGMAGTGKSTISRTVAKRFKREEILGASFFFKRGEGDRGNAMKLFPTITRQLAKSIPQLTSGFRKAIDNNSDIATKGLKEQFDKIILQPLLDLASSSFTIPNIVIVIDALDECDVDNDMRLILRLLPQLQNSEALCFRVLLTSRPELPIRLGFKKLANHDHKDLVLHDIPMEVIEHDLSLFLNHRLSEIREERDPPLPVDWPGAINIQRLVALSVPLFIFATTICRIFEDPDWDPLDSLPEILTHQRDESKLDSTYLPVLDRLLKRQTEKRKKDLVQEFHQVVGAIVTLESPLSVISLSRLIGLPERLVHLRLSSLHSVLRVPNEESLPIQLFHLSFRDFLLDPETRVKTPFWIEKSEMHHRLTISCLHICQGLRKNICQLRSDGTQRTEIDRQTINQYLPPELQYACRYWAFHLAQCEDTYDMMHNAMSFLERHFLHWVEAMCLLGHASEVVGIISLLQNVKSGGNSTLIFEFLQDAKRFILKNRQIADTAPLQIYCSGLIFAPQKARIRKQFESDLPNWISRLPQVEESWSLELQTLEGHSGSVMSVAFSPDRRLLASGSEDNTVRLWDTATGALQQTLEGHSDWVCSVAFSPDDRLLASGSKDGTVRLWDTVTGALQQTFKLYRDLSRLVAFSSDGRLLASSSWDGTIWLWDTATSAIKQTFRAHRDKVLSIAFSPDGRLASGSGDGTVRLWDTATGALKETLTCHSGSVYSVAFSLDGRLLASGSEDGTVLLWDTAISTLHRTLEGYKNSFWSEVFLLHGRLASTSKDKIVRLWHTSTSALQQTLNGHSDSVYSVTFSSDGRLASGSKDGTVRVWDSATGALQQTLDRHFGFVQSVAFSPDGHLASGSKDGTVRLWDTTTGALRQTLDRSSSFVRFVELSLGGRLLASGSEDNTVRLWDTATGALQQTLEGHSGLVRSVEFSSDSRLLASGSEDGTVRLWDTATGALQQTLEGHSGLVRSVKFSPDSRLLVSGSEDDTVRLWDTATGALKQTFNGHWALVLSVGATFSPNFRLLASGPKDGTVWHWGPGKIIRERYRDTIVYDWLASSSEDRTARLLDIPTVAPKRWETWVQLVKFSSEGQLLASGSANNTVRLWDTATGALQQTLKGHLGSVTSAAFSPDDRLLASGSMDNTVRLWDTATGALQQTLKGHSGLVRSVKFSHDGRLLASGSEDDTVRLWDTTTGALQQTLESHLDWVCSVAFSPDDRLLASGSKDNTVRLWDTATGTLQQTLDADAVVTDLKFSHDGLHLTANRRSFSFQSRGSNWFSNSPHMNICLWQGSWVVMNGNKVLWLPPESRPSCSAIVANTLVLGHTSGRISFIEFQE